MKIEEAIDKLVDIGGKINKQEDGTWEVNYGCLYEYVSTEEELIKEIKAFLWIHRVQSNLIGA
jgi:hypothetical protein